MEAMAIEGLRLVCCQTGAGVLVVDMNAYLDKARNMAKIVAYQRAQGNGILQAEEADSIQAMALSRLYNRISR